MALAGLRPVVELRVVDFALCAIDEIVNQAAKNRFMFGGQGRVPALPRMPRVLLIDGDVELTDLLKEYLEQEEFEVTAVHDGESGVAQALSGRHAVAVLDIMMPRLSGMDVLGRIRESSLLPVLMLTAKGADADRITGLELGADDYVPKPCTPRELAARIRAILRRGRTAPGNTARPPLTVGMLHMWPQRRCAQWGDTLLVLTSTEYNLLELLARNAGRLVSKRELSEQGLGRPLARFDRNIDVNLSNLRRKLDALGGRTCIRTVYRPAPPTFPGEPFAGPMPPPGSHHTHNLFPIMPAGIGAIASLVFAALLAWYFSKPIRSLRTAFDAVAHGRLDARPGAEMGMRHDELADLGRNFDDMADGLQALMNGQQQLLHDVSHELRSPLARL
jgi:two-component system response regulator CpxR